MLLFISWKWHTGTEGDWGTGEGRILFSNVLHQPGHLPRKAPAGGWQAEKRARLQGAHARETLASSLPSPQSRSQLRPVLGTDTTQGHAGS